MSEPDYDFQYCQKLVLLSKDGQKLFLAKRQGEADYDSTFAFICGKMETTDKTILAGLKREKDEEIGNSARVSVYPLSTHNLSYAKKDGKQMILPHYLAYYIDGEIRLNVEEYSEYKWIPLEQVEAFKPKVETVPECLAWALEIAKSADKKDFVEI